MEAAQLDTLVPVSPRFRTQHAVRDEIRAACEARPGIASFYDLGVSEEGRPMYGVVLGSGNTNVSLVAGAHADEPVGPETLRTFILEGVREPAALGDLFSHFRFVIVPHVNPDGEARNQEWIQAWPDLEAYLRHVQREKPGRDVEFGYPAMRQENRLVSSFLSKFAPYRLHMSLHGMAFSEGAMLLIERHWAFRTQTLRDGFRNAAKEAGLRMHDHNRNGDKGFFYIEPGFTTTPEGEMMRSFFRAQDDETTAALFHDSSMEFVRSLGGDPLCLVTELPLFVVDSQEPSAPAYPAAYLALKEVLPEVQLAVRLGKPVHEQLARFNIQPLSLSVAMGLQLRALALGLSLA